jgi:hypothetical protein
VGASGRAISLASEDDAFHLEPIESLAGKIDVLWAENDDFRTDIKRPKRRQTSGRKPMGKPTKRPAGKSHGRNWNKKRRKPS